MKQLFSKILLPCPFDKGFYYSIPDELEIKIGDIVKVPFGNRTLFGVVFALLEKEVVQKENLKKIKTIKEKIKDLAVTPEYLSFIQWVARYNLIPLGKVLKMGFSSVFFEQGQKQWGYSINPDCDLSGVKLTKKQEEVLDRFTIVSGVLKGVPKSQSAKHFLDLRMTNNDCKSFLKISPSILRTLVDKNVLLKQEIKKEFKQNINPENFKLLDLSEKQKEIYGSLEKDLFANTHSVSLLEGVTGSGKTEVYFHLMAKALEQNKGQVLLLLPEIILTSQLINRFKKQFNFEPAIWHSQITSSKKREIWQGIVTGKIKILLGARSSLFLPFKNLNLIVVDEEHDHSFKQSENPCYQARDMAVVKAKLKNIPIILCSATPSLETIINTKTKKYKKYFIANRFQNSSQPEFEIIDLKTEKLKKDSYISTKLKERISECLDKKQQTLLFINRRGYAPIVLCQKCGYKINCPHCSCTLTKHKFIHKTICHYCGHTANIPNVCPECNSKESFLSYGTGVERIEEEIQKYFPQARTLLMTSDSIKNSKDNENVLNKILNLEVDIIIGTQMVAKGHHFPELTLVGIIDADIGLFGGDLRSSEKTYQMLTQVAGRAGRESKYESKVVLQTYSSENLIIQYIAQNNKNALLDFEEQSRKLSGLPPFGKMACILLKGKNSQQTFDLARKIVIQIPSHKLIEILGPSPAIMHKIDKYYRYKIIIKTDKKINIQKLISTYINPNIPSSIKIKIDIDPYDFC